MTSSRTRILPPGPVSLPQIHGQDMLTHSRMSCFRTCNRKHYFSYELGIRPDRDATALRIGGCVHKALESLWRDGDLDAALEAVATNYEVLPAWVNSDAAARDWTIESNTVAALIIGYWNHWAAVTPIAEAVEQEFSIAIRSEIRSITVSPSAQAAASVLSNCLLMKPAQRLAMFTYLPTRSLLTRATKSRTTGKATSASSKAMRTSRNMSATLLSVMRACPLMCLTRRESLSVRAEAI